MSYLLLSCTTAALTLQSVFARQFQRKTKGASVMFAALAGASALLFFRVLSGFPMEIPKEVLPYSIAFSVAYSSSILALVIAIGCGKLSVTALINSYSLVIPTLYGVIFLGEELTVFSYIGFALLAISLFLVNCPDGRCEEGKATVRWILAVAVAFVGNGMCSTIQKAQQVACNEKYKNEFMVASLVIAVVFLALISLWKERKALKPSFRAGGYLAVLYGLCNGIVNLLVMILGARMPVSVMFPVISAGSLVLTAIISIFVYKERLSAMQLMGVVLGVFSIIFLNI